MILFLTSSPFLGFLMPFNDENEFILRLRRDTTGGRCALFVTSDTEDVPPDLELLDTFIATAYCVTGTTATGTYTTEHRTLAETAQEMGLKRERVRQIRNQAVRKLCKLSKNKNIKSFLLK